MAEQKNVDKYLMNQFILFYTLRYLWKLKDHAVGELYKTLFPSKKGMGGNKTLYDNILRLQVPYKTMVGHSKRLEELTGLSQNYFTGQYELSVNGLINEDWYRFIQLRKKCGATKNSELKLMEDKIKRGIRLADSNRSSLSEPLKRLIYFAEYGHKKADKTLEDLFREIESKIGECHPNDFEKASLQLLENHQTAIQKHLYHIAAVVTLKKWKETEK